MDKTSAERLIEDRIYQVTTNDPKYQELSKRYNALVKAQKFVQSGIALHLMQERRDEISRIVRGSIVEEQVQIKDMMKDMPKESVNNLVLWTNSIVVMSDWIELLTMRINEVVSEKDPSARVEMFDKIIAVGKEAKNHVDFMGETTSMAFRTDFADNSDAMLEKFLEDVSNFLKSTV